MQISRFCVKSPAFSVDEHSETITTSVPVRPSERKVRRKENMSTKSFMQHKDTEKNYGFLVYSKKLIFAPQNKVQMDQLTRKRTIGYYAGIMAGISYGRLPS